MIGVAYTSNAQTKVVETVSEHGWERVFTIENYTLIKLDYKTNEGWKTSFYEVVPLAVGGMFDRYRITHGADTTRTDPTILFDWGSNKVILQGTTRHYIRNIKNK